MEDSKENLLLYLGSERVKIVGNQWERKVKTSELPEVQETSE